MSIINPATSGVFPVIKLFYIGFDIQKWCAVQNVNRTDLQNVVMDLKKIYN